MTSSPHDAIFKSAFGDPQHTAAELRWLLPSAIAQAIDWSTLRLLPDFSVVVDDLTRATDEELAARGLADYPSLALWLMRDVWDPEALVRGLARRTGTFESLLRGPHRGEYLFRLLRYVALAAEGLRREEFYAKLTALVPSTESYTMTIAEELRREGRAEGQAQGQAQGKVEGQRTMLLAVLEARGLLVSEDVREQVESCDDVEQLMDWARRAVAVNSADELLH